ncbi:hypothetical protein [Hafnia alvei]|uniref:hypothetical protein n=1 Tax=Hafnia alvei TaxID=569 RepID=UPI0010344F15|nr:hypothetical protein [Hafnia alvei]TBM25061.1 hypothetical protein EYY91_18000 [Hafnia alvei]
MTKLMKEQVKFFIETMTDDMHNTTQHEIAETLLSKFDECESLQAKLLAYEQAARNSDLKTLVISEIVDFYSGFESPCEPETVDEAQSQQVEILNRILNWILKELPVPTQKASAMAIRLSSVIDVISDLELSAPAPTKSEIPFGDVEPIEVTDDMVYAFHNQLSDSALTSDEFTDIKHGLCAALMNIPRPAQHVSEPKP